MTIGGRAAHREGDEPAAGAALASALLTNLRNRLAVVPAWTLSTSSVTSQAEASARKRDVLPQPVSPMMTRGTRARRRSSNRHILSRLSRVSWYPGRDAMPAGRDKRTQEYETTPRTTPDDAPELLEVVPDDRRLGPGRLHDDHG